MMSPSVEAAAGLLLFQARPFPTEDSHFRSNPQAIATRAVLDIAATFSSGRSQDQITNPRQIADPHRKSAPRLASLDDINFLDQRLTAFLGLPAFAKLQDSAHSLLNGLATKTSITQSGHSHNRQTFDQALADCESVFSECGGYMPSRDQLLQVFDVVTLARFHNKDMQPVQQYLKDLFSGLALITADGLPKGFDAEAAVSSNVRRLSYAVSADTKSAGSAMPVLLFDCELKVFDTASQSGKFSTNIVGCFYGADGIPRADSRLYSATSAGKKLSSRQEAEITELCSGVFARKGWDLKTFRITEDGAISMMLAKDHRSDGRRTDFIVSSKAAAESYELTCLFYPFQPDCRLIIKWGRESAGQPVFLSVSKTAPSQPGIVFDMNNRPRMEGLFRNAGLAPADFPNTLKGAERFLNIIFNEPDRLGFVWRDLR